MPERVPNTDAHNIGHAAVTDHTIHVENAFAADRAAIDVQPKESTEELLRQARAAFATVPRSLNQAMSDRVDQLGIPQIFKGWKTQSDPIAGQARGWTEWLAAGATDQQLLNVLQWDEHRARTMRERNQVDVRQKLQHFRTALAEAVQIGELDPVLAQKAQETHPEVVFGSAFDHFLARQPAAKAYISPESNAIVINEEQPSAIALGHEFVHLLGTFDHAVLNEGSAELVSRTVWGLVESDVAIVDQGYKSGVNTIQNILAQSGVSVKELSQIFAGADKVENEQRFRRLITERAGIDLLNVAIFRGRPVDNGCNFCYNITMKQIVVPEMPSPGVAPDSLPHNNLTQLREADYFLPSTGVREPLALRHQGTILFTPIDAEKAAATVRERRQRERLGAVSDKGQFSGNLSLPIHALDTACQEVASTEPLTPAGAVARLGLRRLFRTLYPPKPQS